jgi:MoaA/NifB/PqqE/SkfB family radical SAM enzyme
MNLKLLQQKGMTIELLITRKCNMYCSHCFYDCGPKESAKYMDAEMLTKVKKQIEFLIDLNISPVINIVGGEPTINLNEFKRVFD